MAAYYTLQSQARRLPEGSVLVHDALSPVGKAAVAVARSIGARVRVTASTLSEASLVMTELHIPDDHIIRIGQTQSSRRVDIGDFDVIVQAGRNEVPGEILQHLQSFGHIVVIDVDASSSGKRAGTSVPSNSLRNQAVFFVDLAELLLQRPAIVAKLVNKAAGVLKHTVPGSFDICVRPVTHVAHALQLVETDTCDRVTLEAHADSMVPVVMKPQGEATWPTDASYLTTGGLGDLGQRLLSLMARRGAKHLVTLSRRSINFEEHDYMQRKLKTLSPDCRLYCISCDITSEASVRKAADTLTQLGVPPVRGIVQSAAVLYVSLIFY